jgi:glycosyltransferase involved in cell wall biosynthesis
VETARQRARALVRNAPAAASVLWRHLGRTGAKAGSVALRVAPARARGLASAPAVRRRRPDLAALALAASGEREQAADVLTTALHGDASPEPAVVRRIGTTALALDLPDLGEHALDLLADDDPDRPRLAALLAAARGQLAEAGELAADVPGRRGAALRRRLTGETEVLRHVLLDEELTRPAAPRTRPASVSRVLHVVSNALPEVQAGYTIRTHGIVTAQRAAGLEPHVVTRLGFPVDSGHLTATARTEVDGVPYHRLIPAGRLPVPSRVLQDRAVRDLGRLVEEVRPDLLHAHSKHENAQVALVVARRLGLPVVYEVRGLLEETWRSRGGSADTDFYAWSREAETTCMSLADRVVVLAETMRQEVVARGIPAERVDVVPNAVPDAFTAPLPDGRPTRRRLGLDPGDTVFGTVTTLNDYEGVDTLVAALERLDDPGARLLVVGDGPARAALRERAAPLGDRVRFTGRVPHAEVRGLLAAMDAFCVPRRATPVTVLVPPLKPLEAMAAGLPVLVSDLPPLVDLVPPERFGLAAPAGDSDAWAERMAVVRREPELARSLGARAREWVVEHGTWSVAAERYRAVYARTV